MAKGEKRVRDQGWSIVLIDESGFMLQPVIRRTWAPKGKTLFQYSWDRHDRLSVISAATLSPTRQRLGLFFHMHDHNITPVEVMAFPTMIHRRLRRKFILVLDRLNAHRKAVRSLQAAHPDWFEVVWLPAYAPELNSVEMVWNRAEHADLANFIPEDVHDLHQAVTASVDNTRTQEDLVRSFFQHARLEL